MKYVHQEKPPNWSPEIEAVSCICWLDDKMLCLLRNSDKPEGNKWGFPAGKLERNEPRDEALKRELEEELSLVLPETKYLHTFYVRYPDLDFTFNVYESKLDRTPEIKINPEENSEYDWKTVEDFLKEEVVKGNKEILRILYC